MIFSLLNILQLKYKFLWISLIQFTIVVHQYSLECQTKRNEAQGRMHIPYRHAFANLFARESAAATVDLDE